MYKLTTGLLFSMIVTFASLPSHAAYVYTEFDTVTYFKRSDTHITISGKEKNTLTPISIEFADKIWDQTPGLFKQCVPLILTAMEKPGRYYIYIAYESNNINHLKNCEIEVKP